MLVRAPLAITVLRWVCILVLASSQASAEDPISGPEPVANGTVTGFTDWVTSAAFSPDGKVLAVGTYDEIRLIDAASRAEVRRLKTGNGYVRSLAFTPDGSQLLVGDYQLLSMWEVASGRRVKRFPGHTAYVSAVAFVGDRILSGSEDGTVRLWDPKQGQTIKTIEVSLPINDIAVSPDGTHFATAAGDTTRPAQPGQVSLWNVETGEKVRELVGHERTALAVAFSADGDRLASAGEDEKVNLYDLTTGNAIGYYAGHARSVNDVAFLGDGAILASVSGGNAGGMCELRLWRPDGSDVAALEPHPQRIVALAVSPDGKTLALGSHDKTLSLWNVGPVLGIVASDAVIEPIEAPRLP